LTYDKNGNSSSITDPLQNVTTYAYDYKGRPTQKVDALGKITAFSYVATGCPSCGGGGEKLTSLTDAVGSTTSFAYDLRGLLTGITDPLQKVTNLTYDVNGRLTNSTDRNGTALTYAYTPTGMLSSIKYPDTSQVTNTYDNLDRLTGMQDSLGTSSFTYDPDGRITGFTDPDGFVLSYVYDAAGNITQVTYPDNTTVTSAYDAANRLTTVTDWLGGQAIFAYDQDGRPATFTQFNGVPTTYTYDAAGRLTAISSPVASFQFTLDGDGNRIISNESQPLTPSASTGVSAVYTYNAQKNRLLSAGPIMPLTYAYDNEGQLVSSGGTCLTFDYNHRLIEIGNDTTFSYDGRGNRLIATRAGLVTHYIYDPWGNLIAQADGSNNITAKYVYGKGLLAMTTASGRYCHHFNANGNTSALTDMNQNIVNSYAYDPFGQILAQQETVAQPFKYVGQYGVMAEPNGLYYMRARYYDPSVGRFVSEDPLGFGGGDVNLYAYVRNNPVKLVDPSGKNPILIAILAGLYYFFSHHDIANAPTSPTDQVYDYDAAYNPQVQLGMIPILGPSNLLAGEGIYEFTAASGKTYVGQSGDICARIEGHLSSGKLLPEDLASLQTTEVLGGKAAREVAEQLRINELGGIENLENIRNPIGPARQDLLP
jgi:RHS repeat-associated protein